MTSPASAEQEPKLRNFINGWEVISEYSVAQAKADGVLVRVGSIEGHRGIIYFTATLMAEGYGDIGKHRELVKCGFKQLTQPDAEDTPSMRFRVVEPYKVWLVQEPGRLTFMRPEDY